MTAEAKFEPFSVNVRIKISALWTSMLFVFAYIVGSALEVASLAAIVCYAWT